MDRKTFIEINEVCLELHRLSRRLDKLLWSEKRTVLPSEDTKGAISPPAKDC